MDFLSFLLRFIVFCAASALSEPIVHTQFGTLRGKWLKSARDVPVAAYLGIPFAEPPIGPLRFRTPQPWTKHWGGVREANTDGSACVQRLPNSRILGNEDCLYLNVFVPSILHQRQLPVLVFIHGGAYIFGSNNSTYFAPDYLMDQEVILVTVNYRLGILGFLSTGNEASPGNYGVKDVFEALKWIRGNIKYFGGNMNAVTLSGGSAGAGMAHHLALSKRTEDLFDKVITHSGVAIAPWALHPARISQLRFIRLAIEMNCTDKEKMMNVAFAPVSNADYDETHAVDDDYEILECLRGFTAEEITEKISIFDIWLGNPYCTFGPTLEPESDEALITDNPRSIIENGEFRDIPWMSTVVEDEGLTKTAPLYFNITTGYDWGSFFDEVLPALLEMEEVLADNSLFTHALMEFYFPEGFKPDAEESFVNMTALAGDGLFNYWTYEALQTQALAMNSSVYFSKFAYKGTFSATLQFSASRRLGVSHGDDMNYLFPIYNNEFAYLQLHNTEDDRTMINIMTEMICNFVKTGVPSAQLTPDWEPYQEDFRFMKLGMGRSPDISMEENFLPVRMDFWRSLMGNVSVPREQLFFELYEDDRDDMAEDLTKTESTDAISGATKCFFTEFTILLCLTVLFF